VSNKEAEVHRRSITRRWNWYFQHTSLCCESSSWCTIQMEVPCNNHHVWLQYTFWILSETGFEFIDMCWDFTDDKYLFQVGHCNAFSSYARSS